MVWEYVCYASWKLMITEPQKKIIGLLAATKTSCHLRNYAANSRRGKNWLHNFTNTVHCTVIKFNIFMKLMGKKEKTFLCHKGIFPVFFSLFSFIVCTVMLSLCSAGVWWLYKRSGRRQQTVLLFGRLTTRITQPPSWGSWRPWPCGASSAALLRKGFLVVNRRKKV